MARYRAEALGYRGVWAILDQVLSLQPALSFGQQVMRGPRTDCLGLVRQEAAMKLRIHANSLRLRISRSDLKRLIETGRIAETIHFGLAADARLTYSLEQANTQLQMTMVYRPQEVAVIVSSEAAREWADRSEQVGLYCRVAVGDRELELVVEKDFACLDRDSAENRDTFPNPKRGMAC